MPSFSRRRLQRALLCSLPAALPLLVQAAETPGQPEIPAQGLDAHHAVLIWQKPADYREVVDYRVYRNGQTLGSARDNAARLSPVAPYVAHFEAADRAAQQVRTDLHHYRITDLSPDSDYDFSVRAVYRDGSLSRPSATLHVRTPAESPRCDVREQGAKGDGETLDTVALQASIDRCPAGGTVFLPPGRYRSGALFLKSRMTLEIARGATLLGSDRAEDYPLDKGYLLYPYSTVRRPPSLLNAYDPRPGSHTAFNDIRIVGEGVVDGNGWRRDEAAEAPDETGRTAPRYLKGNRSSVDQTGLLAATQVKAGLAAGLKLETAYGQSRSSLMTLRDVDGVYVSGPTFRNPANHGLMFLEVRHATVEGVRIETFNANNGDGVEFGNSTDVKVFDSFFDTGDDCVNFAAGTGADAARQPPMKGAWIFDNYMRHGHGGVVIGSHTGAWIEDLLAEDNVMYLTQVGLRAKSNTANGGGGRQVVYRDNAHRDLEREAVVITLDYSDANQLLDFRPARESGRFSDFRILHNSVVGRPPEAGADMPAALTVTANPAQQVFHQNISIEDLRLSGTGGLRIDGLLRGSLRDIRLDDYRGSGPALSLAHAPALKREHLVLPQP
ncbi:glycoside hydrolase family 28 protein [Uliginosibacterium paludis]|uniref:Glycoside hydrolase family 28 protein n=1 Tax=Uliginosibacterium paludis TaxID=1615952 RepID=A0ABV2CNF2_9RHOO